MSVESFRKNQSFSQNPALTGVKGKIVIAIDGPAASGKGTLARALAQRLGYAWLETGALYRAVGLAVLEMGGHCTDIKDAMAGVAMVKRNLTPELLSSPALRAPAVAEAASQVAALPDVRQALLDLQRDFANNPPGGVGGAILDGRDIGTVVCPKADVKLYVTASAEERARRRFLETNGAGVTYESVLADVLARDERDMQRATAPLRPAEDAYLIDTSKLTPAATMEEAVQVIQARFLAQTQDPE